MYYTYFHHIQSKNDSFPLQIKTFVTSTLAKEKLIAND